MDKGFWNRRLDDSGHYYRIIALGAYRFARVDFQNGRRCIFDIRAAEFFSPQYAAAQKRSENKDRRYSGARLHWTIKKQILFGILFGIDCDLHSIGILL